MAKINKLLLSVGAMKSGTTWLFRQLEQHPEIHFSREKELHYLADAAGFRGHLGFSYRLSRCRNARRRAVNPGWGDLAWYLDYLLLPRDWAWYTRRFAGAGPAQYCADFSNLSALLKPGDWSALRRRVPQLRIIYVLRDPLERLWSHLKFHYQQGGYTEVLRRMSADTPAADLPRGELLEHSLYAKHLGDMLEAIPREHIHIIYYEDIEREPDSVLRGVETFLQLPAHDYAAAKMQRRINPSVNLPRPDWVRDCFASPIVEDLRALQDLDVAVPDSWCAA